jgi:hypothetical protein
MVFYVMFRDGRYIGPLRPDKAGRGMRYVVGEVDHYLSNTKSDISIWTFVVATVQYYTSKLTVSVLPPQKSLNNNNNNNNNNLLY